MPLRYPPAGQEITKRFGKVDTELEGVKAEVRRLAARMAPGDVGATPADQAPEQGLETAAGGNAGQPTNVVPLVAVEHDVQPVQVLPAVMPFSEGVVIS
jgi:hypothetical protein